MFKRAVRQVALKHGIHATFMAKPYQGQPGSSMHIHQNLVNTKTEKIFLAIRKEIIQKSFFDTSEDFKLTFQMQCFYLLHM